MPNLNTLFVHFAPELILTLGILVVLGYDLVVRGRDAAQAWIAIGTLVLALLATLWLWTLPPATIFEVRSPVNPSEVIRAGTFASDGFTNFFRTLGLLTTLLVMMSGITYMRRRTPFKGEFYALVLCAALAMNLMAGANDLIIIALAIEFLSLTSYILTAFLRDDKLSLEGGLKYFLYGSIISAAMLFGMTLVYGATGSTSLPVIGAVTADSGYMLTSGLGAVLLPGIILIVAGIGFKIALVPFHQWSPDAYQGAPTPITAFLSVGPKAAGFAVLLRLMLTAFGASLLMGGWLPALAALAVLTMIVGNFGALTQNNVKRMMAYSSIAQAGYMMIGLVALGSGQLTGVDPVSAVLFYLLAYLFTNLGGFAVITAVDHATGSSDIEAFNGLIRRAPFLAVSLAIFFLSLVGIPPLAGFVGKFAVFGAAMASGQVLLALIGVLTGVVSVGYYFRVMKAVFFGPVEADEVPIRPAPALMFVIPVALLMTFVIGLMPGPFLAAANQAAAVVAPVVAAVAGE